MTRRAILTRMKARYRQAKARGRCITAAKIKRQIATVKGLMA